MKTRAAKAPKHEVPARPTVPPWSPAASLVGVRPQRQRRSPRRGASLLQSLVSAVEALNRNRLRSLLTALGIIIGVGAVIVMVAIGQGASAATNNRLAGLGPNTLTIFPGSARNGPVRQSAGSAQTLTQADADAIAGQVANIAGVSPILDVQGQVVYQDQNTQAQVHGVYPSDQQIANWQMAEGSFISESDETGHTSVAVLGQSVVEALFTAAGVDPVGQQIRIGNHLYTIEGVLAKKGGSSLGDADNVIFVPFSTAERLTNQPYVNQIVLQVTSTNAVTQAQRDIQQLLEQRHKIPSGGQDDFSIFNQSQVLQTAQGVAQTLTFLLVGVASVSLVVGGIGIMNIMLVSVTERTREIGIRLAVGARRRDILSQFLIEAVVLSGVGGLIGIGVGIGAAVVVNHVGNLPTLIETTSVFLAFGVAATVGILFGFYPAWRASRLDPMVALRVD